MKLTQTQLRSIIQDEFEQFQTAINKPKKVDYRGVVIIDDDCYYDWTGGYNDAGIQSHGELIIFSSRRIER